jgi:hypothetical protein
MLDAFQLASADVIEFQTMEAQSIIDLSGVKYNVYIDSRDENEKVML